MKRVVSADGTSIAFEELGAGPTLVLVDGAFCRRDFGPMRPLAKRLSSSHRVVFYDPPWSRRFGRFEHVSGRRRDRGPRCSDRHLR